MSTVSISNLSWGQRFALIDAYHTTDDDACKILGVTSQELTTARALVDKGVFQVDTTLNIEPYGVLFGKVSKTSSKTLITTQKGTTKKRGRRGDKILNAFAAIPTEPTPAEQFVNDYSISMPVLRQFKRFDKSELPGQVNVRKRDGILMVWRSSETTKTEPENDQTN